MATGGTAAASAYARPVDYPRYKPIRFRPPGKGAFADFATCVLSGVAEPLRRPRAYRSWRKLAMDAAKDKLEGNGA